MYTRSMETIYLTLVLTGRWGTFFMKSPVQMAWLREASAIALTPLAVSRYSNFMHFFNMYKYKWCYSFLFLLKPLYLHFIFINTILNILYFTVLLLQLWEGIHAKLNSFKIPLQILPEIFLIFFYFWLLNIYLN